MQALDEAHLHILPIQVGVEIEQMGFDGQVAATERGLVAHRDGRHPLAPAGAGPARVSCRPGHRLGSAHGHVGGRKPQLTAALVALHHLAMHRVVAAEQVGRRADLARSDQPADRRAVDLAAVDLHHVDLDHRIAALAQPG